MLPDQAEVIARIAQLLPGGGPDAARHPVAWHQLSLGERHLAEQAFEEIIVPGLAVRERIALVCEQAGDTQQREHAECQNLLVSPGQKADDQQTEQRTHRTRHQDEADEVERQQQIEVPDYPELPGIAGRPVDQAIG